MAFRTKLLTGACIIVIRSLADHLPGKGHERGEYLLRVPWHDVPHAGAASQLTGIVVLRFPVESHGYLLSARLKGQRWGEVLNLLEIGRGASWSRIHQPAPVEAGANKEAPHGEGSMRTRKSLSELIEGPLSCADGRGEPVKLATGLTIEEALEAESRDVRWSWFLGQKGGGDKMYSGAVDHGARVLFDRSCCSGATDRGAVKV